MLIHELRSVRWSWFDRVKGCLGRTWRMSPPFFLLCLWLAPCSSLHRVFWRLPGPVCFSGVELLSSSRLRFLSAPACTSRSCSTSTAQRLPLELRCSSVPALEAILSSVGEFASAARCVGSPAVDRRKGSLSARLGLAPGLVALDLSCSSTQDPDASQVWLGPLRYTCRKGFQVWSLLSRLTVCAARLILKTLTSSRESSRGHQSASDKGPISVKHHTGEDGAGCVTGQRR